MFRGNNYKLLLRSLGSFIEEVVFELLGILKYWSDIMMFFIKVIIGIIVVVYDGVFREKSVV